MRTAANPSGVPWRTYQGYRTANRQLALNRHSVMPRLDLRSQTAWFLAWDASLRRIHFADVISEALDSWVDARIAELTPNALADFRMSIPVGRGRVSKGE